MDQSIVQSWFANKGDQTLRINYDLNPNSFVVDFGAYKGQWAKTIVQKYKCHVAAFEPIPALYEESKQAVIQYPQVKVYNYGVGAKTESLEINVAGDASSLFATGGEKQTVSIRAMADVSTEIFPDEIDLIKINIEGGEFDILDWMLEHGEQRRYKNIQVQFHDFYPDAVQRRNRIRYKLAKTHSLTYDYEFVWENWKRNV